MDKHCYGYCGKSCIDGSCPKALYEDNPEYFDGVPSCKDCAYYEGCKDCCIAFYSNISQEQCRKEHNIKERDNMKKDTKPTDDFTMLFSERLKKLRKDNNMKQSYLAKKLNTTAAGISAYEHGVCLPTIRNIMILAKVFNITVDELLNFYPIDFDDSK